MPSEQPVIKLPPVSRSARNPLLAAYHLAEGAYGTTRDHWERLQVIDPDMSSEFAWLAASLNRMCELLKEAGVKP
jgi:hypothetical protein